MDGKKAGRVLAQEIMVVTPAISNLIREGKGIQIYSAMQTGAQYGMITLESALKNLYNQRLISYDDALAVSSRPDDLIKLMGI